MKCFCLRFSYSTISASNYASSPVSHRTLLIISNTAGSACSKSADSNLCCASVDIHFATVGKNDCLATGRWHARHVSRPEARAVVLKDDMIAV